MDTKKELGIDAAEWAKTIAEVINNDGEKALADLPAWCANMIEAGRSEGYAKGQADLSEAVSLSAFVSDFAAKPTDGLPGDPEMIDAAVKYHGFALIPSTDDVYIARHAHISSLVDASMRIAEMRIPEMGLPPDGVSLTDYANSIKPGGAYKLHPVMVGRLLNAAHDEGVKLGRQAGLNDKGEYPTIVLEQSNAVVVYVTSISDHRVHVDVDGRNRLTVEGAELVTLIDNGNRTVLRSPNMAGPAEPEPEPVKTPVFSDDAPPEKLN